MGEVHTQHVGTGSGTHNVYTIMRCIWHNCASIMVGKRGSRPITCLYYTSSIYCIQYIYIYIYIVFVMYNILCIMYYVSYTLYVLRSSLNGGCICSLRYFLFQPVWSIKGCGMCCPVYGKAHIKDPLLLIGKSSLCGDSPFPLKKYVKMTICLVSDDLKINVL